MAIIQKKADDYVQQSATQAILGSPENFDKAWDEIQNTLNSYGVDKLNQGVTDLVKERLELWGN
ncbi:hypothetical protein NSA50_06235 [Clostridium sp. DSM 100503]|uniref:hypothetical protein n=1 Tax=Clostridium sp. DSM 100503 TaxID=2963282 RepID=UPI00214A1B13|nr:hypothetical protein [Clostridium sp. DSM 100503]MCR1950658.1 hypothetical protein [Clostridium sp. DSM 100503]